ncbi:glycosyltransferase family 9 protein [Myceligenerans pegani]|uniref:Glycosyltransferase family 9 protein n=1 Tax=Myceligenerans pegani TaxID=2776917 RepID=A0ABR9MYV8_9MICO|nr:glycosyltransferase family 9 protein [Myceligenerans sp. TRM 65318]MBE1876557.1 glycosyltransferase family 9 protein [Myceligenerans sp. TRM 65318]MBE3018828.1 glycosyltransferase family 9 protein [Myceligenerans sp. TRM 65318]
MTTTSAPRPVAQGATARADRAGRVLAVRLDSDGDVLVTGPAIRALAATYGQVDLLVSGSGAQAAELLPGVAETLRFDAPWSGMRPPRVSPESVLDLVATLIARRYRLAVIFTSFHQSPLPMALLARLAGVPRIVATSEDYPGSLLDVRHHRPPGLHEVDACLDLAALVGAQLPPDDDGRLAVRGALPASAAVARHDDGRAHGGDGGDGGDTDGGDTVVVHPGASVPARAPRPEDARAFAERLAADGWDVRVTGSAQERELTAYVSGDHAVDLGGRTNLAELAAVLRAAACVVAGNTGPAHLAAAVGTPVVSLFAPVVPLERWTPYGVPLIVLGDQGAACRGTRARTCPVPGHPCLASVTADQVSEAVARLARRPVRTAARLGRCSG